MIECEGAEEPEDMTGNRRQFVICHFVIYHPRRASYESRGQRSGSALARIKSFGIAGRCATDPIPAVWRNHRKSGLEEPALTSRVVGWLIRFHRPKHKLGPIPLLTRARQWRLSRLVTSPQLGALPSKHLPCVAALRP